MAIFSDFFSAGLLSLFTFKTFVSSLFQVQFSISFNTIFEETTAVRQGGTSLLKETKLQLVFLTELLPALVPSVKISLVFLDLSHYCPLRSPFSSMRDLSWLPCEVHPSYLSTLGYHRSILSCIKGTKKCLNLRQNSQKKGKNFAFSVQKRTPA